MEEIENIKKEIIEDFEMFEDWDQKYQYLIDLGKELESIDESKKIDINLIKGCQSLVWLDAEYKDQKVFYYADSNAILTRGLIALLLKVFNQKTPDQIIKTELDFLDKIGLQQHLSPTRANGLLSMVKQIKFYAVALSNKK